MRDYLEENQPALETWREGAERPDAMYHQPGEMAADTVLPVVQDLRTLGRLAGLEGSRHEEQGEMEEAWAWYKAMLRSSRHVGRHGVMIERLVGAAILEESARRILHWAADPRVERRAVAPGTGRCARRRHVDRADLRDDEARLHRLPRDLEELRVMVEDIPMPGGPNGLLEKIVAASGAKTQVQRIRLRATNDVERSRRVLRLLYANWLPQVDKPADQRAPIAIRKPTLIYAAGPDAPPIFACDCAGGSRQGDRSNVARAAVFSSVVLGRCSRRAAVVGLGMGRRSLPGPGAETARGADRQAGCGTLPARAREAACELPDGLLVGYLKELPAGIKAGRADSGGD